MHRISLQVDEKHTVLGSRYRSGAYVPRFGPRTSLCKRRLGAARDAVVLPSRFPLQTVQRTSRL